MREIVKIVKSIQNGDEQAFVSLVKQYDKLLHRYVEKYCDLYPNIFEHNDLYQLALLALYHSAQHYDIDSGTPFLSYYLILLERDILMSLRCIMSQKNRANVNVVSLDKMVAETDGIYIVDAIENKNENFEPAKYMDKMELYQRIEETLTMFSKVEADVFRSWIDGYSYDEIAKQQGLNRKRVEYIIRKVRRNMCDSLWQWRYE